MGYFESEQKLLKTLQENLGDENFADTVIEKIYSIGAKYDLTLGEIGNIFDILNDVITKRINTEQITEKLSEVLYTTQDETLEISITLEDIIDILKKAISVNVELKNITQEILKKQKYDR